ncbi:MAG: hypothetical protein ABIW76_10455, partial [Fibrobacteria bacterium]
MIEWEEGIFRAGRAVADAVWNRPRRKPFLQAEAGLGAMRMELFYYAHLLAGESLAIFETDEPILRL